MKKSPSKTIKKVLPKKKEEKNLEWAKGTEAAGIQVAGLKNYNQAIEFLEKAGELPKEIKTNEITHDFIKNYYETKKIPVVGDVFINKKGREVEIVEIKDRGVVFYVRGEKKQRHRMIFIDKFYEAKPTSLPSAIS